MLLRTVTIIVNNGFAGRHTLFSVEIMEYDLPKMAYIVNVMGVWTLCYIVSLLALWYAELVRRLLLYRNGACLEEGQEDALNG